MKCFFFVVWGVSSRLRSYPICVFLPRKLPRPNSQFAYTIYTYSRNFFNCRWTRITFSPFRLRKALKERNWLMVEVHLSRCSSTLFMVRLAQFVRSIVWRSYMFGYWYIYFCCSHFSISHTVMGVEVGKVIIVGDGEQIECHTHFVFF